MSQRLLRIVLGLAVLVTQVQAVGAQTTVFDLGQVLVNPEEPESQDLTIEEKFVISQKALTTYKVVDVSEVLADELIEASMIRKSGYGNEVGLRGFTKSNLRFTQDDTLIEGSCGSRKDPPLSHINMLTVKSLEVKEGPFDVTVPGALGGNINVVTKDPQEGLHGEVFSKFGSYGFLSQGAYVTGGSDIAQGLFGYNYSTSDQYEDGAGNKLSTFNSGYSEEGQGLDAFEKHDVWGKMLWKPAEDREIMFSSSYGQANDVMTPRVGMDTEEEKTYLNKIEYRLKNLSALSQQLAVSVYYNRIEHYPTGKYRSTAANANRIEAISYITGVQVENQTLTDMALFTYGTDFYYRNWYGDIVNRSTGAMVNDELFPDVDELDFGMYLKAERDYEKLSLSAGIRADVFHTEAQENLKNSSAMTGSNAQTDVYPSGFVFGKYFLDEDTNIFAGSGLTTRTPTAVERYTQQGTLYGNPDLEPAHNFETDLGFETKFSQRMMFRVKGFYSFVKDYIYQTTVPAKTWTNIDAFLYGGDVNLSYDLGGGFSFDAGLAYQRGRKIDQPAANDDEDLAEIAPLKTKLALNYDNNSGLSAVFEWIHSEDHSRIDSSGGEASLKGWEVFNFRAGYQFSHQREKMSFLNGASLNIGIDNIFDRNYAVANSYEYDPTDPGGTSAKIVNEPGRFIYGSLTFRF